MIQDNRVQPSEDLEYPDCPACYNLRHAGAMGSSRHEHDDEEVAEAPKDRGNHEGRKVDPRN